MAKNAATNQQPTIQEDQKDKKTGFFEYLRFGESYTSLILGIIVVIIATAFLLSFVHNKNAGNVNSAITQSDQYKVELTQKANDMAQKAPKQISDNAQATAAPTEEVSPTEQPTAAPRPTAVPKPTVAPKPTKAVKPTLTPKPTKASKPTMAPKPTVIAKKIEVTKAPVQIVKQVPTAVPQVKTDKDNNIWTVQKGETLWAIAEKKYNSGYNWVDIARVNKLSNPSDIHVGDRLKLPAVQAKPQTIAKTVMTDDEQNSKTVQKITTQPKPTAKPAVKLTMTQGNQMTKITGNSYHVVRGDSLWNIAVRAYSDGYRWVDIAKANHLANPRVIHAGNTFIIPRGK